MIHHTATELMQIHVQTLFTSDPSSRLININEPWPGSGPAPKFFLGRTTDATTVRRYRQDIPDAIVSELEELSATENDLHAKPAHFETYMRLLHGEKYTMGPSYFVPDDVRPSMEIVHLTSENTHLLQGGFEWLIAELAYVQPCIAVVIDNQAVSVCRSVRITVQAHEAGMETLAAFRGKGYAAEALGGWSDAVRALGSLPMYSTSRENTASQAVARKAGLLLYGSGFSVE